MPGGGGFSCGVDTSWDAERAGQGTSGTYRWVPDGVLAVGETGLTWGFDVWAGWPRGGGCAGRWG